MSNRQETADKRGRTGRVEGTDLVVEQMKVVVQDQAKASDPAPLLALVEPDATHPLDLYLNSQKKVKAPYPFLAPAHGLSAADLPPYP